MRQLIAFIAFVFIFSSCADKSKNDITVFRATEEGLQQSVRAISISNEMIYRSLEDKLADPDNTVYAMVWQPKATVVKVLSDTIITYILQLKEELKDEAGFSNPPDRESFKVENIPAVNHFFNEHDKGKELFTRLIKYRQLILAVDTQLNDEFKNNMVIFANGFDHTRNDTAAFAKSFFTDIPVIAACAMLSKLENNIRIIENNFILFCHNKISSVSFDGEGSFIQPLVTQSSSYVKAGEKIEINAGIGYLSTTLQPRITINQKLIQLNENGVAVYKFKTPLKAGKYYMPVKIEYIQPDGSKGTMEKSIEYTVIEENEAP